MKRLGCCAALALLASCGTYTSPWTSYDCTVVRSGENGEFRDDEAGISWTYDVSEELKAVVVMSFPYAVEFLETGFSPETRPTLAIGYSPGVATPEGAPPLALSVDVRIGERALRASGSDAHSATFAYEEWSPLLSEQGDMRVALIDDRNGAVLSSGVIRRSVLDSVEPTLEEVVTEHVDKALHQEDRCTPYIRPGAGIIVT